MKNQTILLLTLALIAIIGCEKNNGLELYDKRKSQATIILKIEEYGLSKSVGKPYTATPVTIGTTFNINSFFGSEILDSNNVEFARVGETNVYEATVPIYSKATSMTITGNYDGTAVDGITLSSDVNTRQGDQTKPIILVSGSGSIVEESGLNTVTLNLIPEMARIEIIPDYTGVYTTPSTIYKLVNLKAVYLNNTKTTRDGNVVDTPSGTFSGRNNDFHHTGSKSKLYEALSLPPDGTPHEPGWPIIDTDGTAVKGDYDAIGYNIFPQNGGSDAVTAKQNHPHIIFYISGLKKNLSSTFESFGGYININALNDENGNYVTSFDAGSVYIISLGDIINLVVDTNTEITTDPDPYSVKSISCSVSNLELKTVYPKIII